MRNIIIFIRRYITFFVFLLLQIMCISMLVKYNATYQAAYMNIAGEITGYVQQKYNDIEYYFQLKKTNNQLVQENAELRNIIISALQKDGDTSSNHSFSRIDSLFRDTLGRDIKYVYSIAKVVNNAVTNENNYITIQKGSKDGITTDMAVDGPDGIVGHVVAVSKNYSIVMSLLNHNSKVSAMFKKDRFTGVIEWNGDRPDELIFPNVPKTEKLRRGDTVITSNLSGNFPPGLIIGRVQRVRLDPSSNLMSVVLKAATNFYNLQYVYLIKNTYYTEQKALETATQQQQPVKK